MTDTERDLVLAERGVALRAEAARQAAELRQRQRTGQQVVGPWAPAAIVKKPRAKKMPGRVTPMRKRA